MGRLRWYKRYPRDFLEGTRGLTLEEAGAYSKVLDLIYDNDNRLADDDAFIAGNISCQVRVWRRLRGRLIQLNKLYVEGGLLRNPTADRVAKEALEILGKRVEAGKSSRNQSGGNDRFEEPEPNGSKDLAGAHAPAEGGISQREDLEREDIAAAATVTRTHAREEAAAAGIPLGQQTPIEVTVLERVAEEHRAQGPAALQLAAWKAEFGPKAYASTLAAANREARMNIMVVADRKFGDLRRNRHRAEAEAQRQHAGGWSVEGIAAGAAERVMAASDAWTVTACPQIETDR
jgi:hypothetical protein